MSYPDTFRSRRNRHRWTASRRPSRKHDGLCYPWYRCANCGEWGSFEKSPRIGAEFGCVALPLPVRAVEVEARMLPLVSEGSSHEVKF